MIHKTAIIHKKAKLENNVTIGPNSIIGENVLIKEGTVVGANCNISGRTIIGKNCEIFTGAIVGSVAQDKKYTGGEAFLEIGDNNKIREYVTINLGSDEKDKTVIGDNNLFMAYSHIAHNCKIGNNAILANAATLAGHVILEDRVVIGGLSAIHQFVRVGTLAIVGGCSKVVQDITPFLMADGHPAKIYGINAIGLKRAGISEESKKYIKRAFKILFLMKLNTQNAIKQIEKDFSDNKEVAVMIAFIKASQRGIAR